MQNLGLSTNTFTESLQYEIIILVVNSTQQNAHYAEFMNKIGPESKLVKRFIHLIMRAE